MPNIKTMALCHHGIKGMHWGVKNGPPYPLSKETSRSMRANRYYEVYGERNTKSNNSLLASEPGAEKLSDLQRKTGKLTLAEDAQLVNDVRNRTRVGRIYNCQNCSAAVEMRARGYDVAARMRDDGSNVFNPEKWFDGGKFTMVDNDDLVSEYVKATGGKYDSKKYNNMCQISYWRFIHQLKQQPSGSRGIVTVGWCDDAENIKKRTSYFHAFNYTVSNGGITFIDAEGRGPLAGGRPHIFSADTYSDNGVPLDVDPREWAYMRTDNLQVNESITEAVISRKLVDK